MTAAALGGVASSALCDAALVGAALPVTSVGGGGVAEALAARVGVDGPKDGSHAASASSENVSAGALKGRMERASAAVTTRGAGSRAAVISGRCPAASVAGYFRFRLEKRPLSSSGFTL